MASNLFLLSLLVVRPLLCRSAFDDPSALGWCWYNSCITNEGGRVCFKPSTENVIQSTTCDGGFSYNPAFQATIDAHLYENHGYSIAYYDYNTSALLGNFTYPVPAGKTVKLCLSGITNDGGYQTWCMQVNKDNDITDPRTFCWVRLGQTFVSDGCYIAMPPKSGTAPTTLPTATSSGSSGNSSSQLLVQLAMFFPIIFLIIEILGLVDSSNEARSSSKMIKTIGNITSGTVGGEGSGIGGRQVALKELQLSREE